MIENPGGCSLPHLLTDDEREVDVYGRVRLLATFRFEGGERNRGAGLVVEAARDDEAVVEELRARIDRHEVSNLDTELLQGL